jgi:hypothetical protein
VAHTADGSKQRDCLHDSVSLSEETFAGMPPPAAQKLQPPAASRNVIMPTTMARCIPSVHLELMMRTPFLEDAPQPMAACDDGLLTKPVASSPRACRSFAGPPVDGDLLGSTARRRHRRSHYISTA